MTVIEQIGQGRNVSLTTFRRDGRRVATALWFVVDDGELFVLTAPDSGKVKRIRGNGRVVIGAEDSVTYLDLLEELARDTDENVTRADLLVSQERACA